MGKFKRYYTRCGFPSTYWEKKKEKEKESEQLNIFDELENNSKKDQ